MTTDKCPVFVSISLTLMWTVFSETEVANTVPLTVFTMLWQQLNEFFSATTIHGLHYISDQRAACTRFVWTVFVLVALAAASVFLYHTFQDWETKYISTTLGKGSFT